MKLCAGRAPSLQHTRGGGGRQGASPKATTVGVGAVGAEVSFSSVFFPYRAEEFGVGGRNTDKERNPLFPG